MRILQLANFYAPTSGGLRVAVDQLGSRYRARGHEAVLVAPGPVTRVAGSRIEIAAPRLPNRTGYRVILSRRALRWALETVAPDVVEIHDKLLLASVARWAHRRGVPVVAISHERLDVTVADLVPRLPVSVGRAVATSLAQRVVEHSDAVVVCSDFAGAEFTAQLPVAATSMPPVVRVPLGVDLETFQPASSRDRGDGPLRLVCVSRLAPEKRPDVAIGALEHLIGSGHAAELTLLGAGPWERRLRARARGLPVTFGGFVSRPDVARALAHADVAVAPGPAETFGLAALEALACGTPVVVTAGAGTAELIAGEASAGRAAGCRPDDVAAAVRSLLAVPEPVRRAAARRAAWAHSWPRCAAAMLDVHAAVLAGAHRAARPAAPPSAPPTAQRKRPRGAQLSA